MAGYDKPDFWAQKAQDEGYPARSVYKLKELDEKFTLLKNPHNGGKPFRVLDLGAAPGSWSLYMLRRSKNTILTAIDLSPLSRVYDKGLFESMNFIFIQGDMLDADNRETILYGGPYDLVLSDAAPSTSGNRSLDTLRSLELAETALDYAKSASAPGANLVVKVFQGGDTSEFIRSVRKVFNKTKSFKPQACRPDSFEVYIIGLDKSG